MPFALWQKRENFLQCRRVAFVEEFLHDRFEIQAEFVNPHRAAERLLERPVKDSEGQAELCGEELKLCDLARGAGQPPSALEQRNRARATDGLLM